MGARSTGSHPTTTKADGHLLEYFRQTFGAGGGGTNFVPVSDGLTATGGIISDYSDPGSGNVYRAHIFTSSGELDVTALGDFGDTVEYLVVAGGGGGGYDAGGGGGGGAFRTNLTGHPLAQSAFPVSVSPYTVTIGAGGGGSGPNTPNRGGSGVDSVFGSITSPGGGGGGGVSPPSDRTGSNGGSGGGGAMSFNGGKGAYPGSPNPSPFRMGYDGGNGTDNGGDNIASGGGGGAGGAGSNGTAPAGPGGAGGPGSPIAIESATAKLYAGGGGGGAKSGPGAGGPGGGGAGGHRPSTAGTAGTYATGGGGGGGAVNPPAGIGGNGGSGIVVVRYQIGQLTATAKATGGAISFYGSKTIHTFTGTGTFETPGSFSETCDYVVVGGGGGGFTGGGGAGGYRTGTTPIGSSVNYTITVGAGADSKSPIGSPSSIGTIPIAIPGGGSSRSGPEGGAAPGASGGGGTQGGGGSTGASGTGSPYPGSIGATPPSGWGHAGGNGQPSDKTGGGGGGAGGAGNPNATGGTGVQLPTTFRDPNGFKYDNFPDHPFRPSGTAGYFVAGGGAGTVYTPFPQASPPLGPTPYSSSYTGVGGVGGGGSRNPADPRVPVYGFHGMANTGGGGAGGTPANPLGARGGSGLVLIAYPT